MKNHEHFMRFALALAKRGTGKVNPNPLVGAVIVKDDQIIGEGWHEEFGGPHAEVNAIKKARAPVASSILYVTLEPCSHYGKTPPCVELIIREKLSKVVIGTTDVNPLVAGKGIEMLRQAGIQVETGILEEECLALNEVFFKYIRTKRPFVLMKGAVSLDGKIATVTGESQWISSAESRAEVHQLRGAYKGIMVGIETVLKDNPSLTCRLPGQSNPIRIIVDSRLRTPADSRVLKTLDQAPTIIATTAGAPAGKVTELRSRGVTVLVLPAAEGKVDIEALMAALGELGIDGILLEGGGTLNFSLLQAKAVDKVQFYVAPIILGGKEAKSAVAGDGFPSLAAGCQISNVKARKIGSDICLEGYIEGGTDVYRNH